MYLDTVLVVPGDFVMPVVIVATIATLLMIAAMLYLVWIALGQDQHRANGGDTA